MLNEFKIGITTTTCSTHGVISVESNTISIESDNHENITIDNFSTETYNIYDEVGHITKSETTQRAELFDDHLRLDRPRKVTNYFSSKNILDDRITRDFEISATTVNDDDNNTLEEESTSTITEYDYYENGKIKTARILNDDGSKKITNYNEFGKPTKSITIDKNGKEDTTYISNSMRIDNGVTIIEKINSFIPVGKAGKDEDYILANVTTKETPDYKIVEYDFTKSKFSNGTEIELCIDFDSISGHHTATKIVKLFNKHGSHDPKPITEPSNIFTIIYEKSCKGYCKSIVIYSGKDTIENNIDDAEVHAAFRLVKQLVMKFGIDDGIIYKSSISSDEHFEELIKSDTPFITSEGGIFHDIISTNITTSNNKDGNKVIRTIIKRNGRDLKKADFISIKIKNSDGITVRYFDSNGHSSKCTLSDEDGFHVSKYENYITGDANEKFLNRIVETRESPELTIRVAKDFNPRGEVVIYTRIETHRSAKTLEDGNTKETESYSSVSLYNNGDPIPESLLND